MMRTMSAALTLGDNPDKDPVTILDTVSSRMTADIYTKAFTDPLKWYNALRLINIIDEGELQEFMSSDFTWERAKQSPADELTAVEEAVPATSVRWLPGRLG